MTNLDELWATCSASLRKQVPEPTWNAWLAPLVLLEASGSRFVIAAPNSLVRERVTTRFQTLIEEALADATSNVPTHVEIVVKAPPPEVLFTMGEDHAREETGVDLSEPEGRQAGLHANAEQSGLGQGRLSAGLSRGNVRAQPMLYSRYTFEAFVIGASNRFAHAAAQRVAEEPAKAYNPLFIYGASGLGKTHILHAIGNYDNQIFPSLGVCYVSTETFLNEFIDAIRTKGQTAFKRRYRAYDVLLVDDIQLLEGKKETQEEFFYTFNSFYEAEKQIVISSDRHPTVDRYPRGPAPQPFRVRANHRYPAPGARDAPRDPAKKVRGRKGAGPRGRSRADRNERQGQHTRARRSTHKALRLREHPQRRHHAPAGREGPVRRDRQHAPLCDPR